VESASAVPDAFFEGRSFFSPPLTFVECFPLLLAIVVPHDRFPGTDIASFSFSLKRLEWFFLGALFRLRSSLLFPKDEEANLIQSRRNLFFGFGIRKFFFFAPDPTIFFRRGAFFFGFPRAPSISLFFSPMSFVPFSRAE